MFSFRHYSINDQRHYIQCLWLPVTLCWSVPLFTRWFYVDSIWVVFVNEPTNNKSITIQQTFHISCISKIVIWKSSIKSNCQTFRFTSCLFNDYVLEKLDHRKSGQTINWQSQSENNCNWPVIKLIKNIASAILVRSTFVRILILLISKKISIKILINLKK